MTATAFNAPLPFRTSDVLGSFAGDPRVIPHRYGEAYGNAIQADAARRLFVWADHPVSVVRAVYVDGVPALSWRWRNGTDSTGHPVAFVEFASPVSISATVAAAGVGKFNSATGAPITNPADLAADLYRMAGRSAVLTAFRAYCADAGYIAGGSLGLDGVPTLNAALRAVAVSFGALYCSAGREPLFALGSGVASYAVTSLQDDGRHDYTGRVEAAGYANRLRAFYGTSEDGPAGSVTVEVARRVAEDGAREAQVTLPLVTDAVTAQRVAARLCANASRGQLSFAVPASRARGNVSARVGDRVTLSLAGLSAATDATITETRASLDGRQAVAGIAFTEAAPAVRIVAQASRFAAQPLTGAAAQTVGDERIVTLTETSGEPIGQAAVTLRARSLTRYTDSSGRVSFPVASMPPGDHWLDVTTGDGRTLSLLVTVR